MTTCAPSPSLRREPQPVEGADSPGPLDGAVDGDHAPEGRSRGQRGRLRRRVVPRRGGG